MWRRPHEICPLGEHRGDYPLDVRVVGSRTWHTVTSLDPLTGANGSWTTIPAVSGGTREYSQILFVSMGLTLNCWWPQWLDAGHHGGHEGTSNKLLIELSPYWKLSHTYRYKRGINIILFVIVPLLLVVNPNSLGTPYPYYTPFTTLFTCSCSLSCLAFISALVYFQF